MRERIAIIGASSQLARDLIGSFVEAGRRDLMLYVRDVGATSRWLAHRGLDLPVRTYSEYGRERYRAVINFVGVGDPRRAAQMGGDILRITQEFDDLVLDGLRSDPENRYIFLSSGAAYGSRFQSPADADTQSQYMLNHLAEGDFYSIAKFHAECKHRALPDLDITDLRVFNYFSASQDLNARFFISDVLRAILEARTLRASSVPMVRDYLGPGDFHQLIECILQSDRGNRAVDCYTREPIEKRDLLRTMAEDFGLSFVVTDGGNNVVDATGSKPNYYSNNRFAELLGYRPTLTSKEVLVDGARQVLQNAFIRGARGGAS